MTRKIIISVLLLLIASIILILFLIHTEAPDFYRVSVNNEHWDMSNFNYDRSTGLLVHKEGRTETKIRMPSQNLYFFNLKGQETVLIEPKIKGRSGFFSYLHFQSPPEKKIHCRLILRAEKGDRELAHIQRSNFHSPLIRSFSLGAKDSIVLSFSGDGIVSFSPPILYTKKAPEERNHIFLIGADTLRGDCVGMKVNGESLTPHLDLFKKDSVDFSRCYSQSSWTLPAFLCLFTSLYEFNLGVARGVPLSQNKPFLVEELSKKYLAFSYNGGAFVGKKYGYSRGYDSYNSLVSLTRSGSGEILFKKAIQFIQETEFPNLFLFLHTYQLHSPYVPKPDFLRRVNKNPEILKFRGYHARTKYKNVSDKQAQAFFDLYKAEVAEFDHYFGDFVARLKEMRIYDSSMIVFVSDHGEEFFEHGGWTHGHSLYNELIKIPLIIKFPQNRHGGSEIRDNAGIIDVFPTILDFHKIKFDSDSVDGTSLLPLLKGKKIKRNTLFSSLSCGRMIYAIPPKFSILSQDLKLIYNYPFKTEDFDFFHEDSRPQEPETIEVFNTEEDAQEKKNIVREAKIPDEFLSLIEDGKLLTEKAIKEEKGEKFELSKEELERLKALGYIDQ